jgi:SAM-dependent methyltransferase
MSSRSRMRKRDASSYGNALTNFDMMCNTRGRSIDWAILLCALLAVLGGGGAACSYGAEASGPSAQELLQASQVKGGLVVHLGCGDGSLTLSLAAGDAYVVQGLDIEPAEIEAARAAIHARARTGPVSVARLGGRTLPYASGLVNLLVVSARWQVADEELARVTALGGCVLVAPGVQTPTTPQLVAVSVPDAGVGRWMRFQKSVPPELDEWTHFLHGPDGHVMSGDEVVGPPWHIQWVAAPRP